MGRRNYEGSKKQHIIKLINMGYSDSKIEDIYKYNYGYIKHVRQRAAKQIQPAFYFQSTGSTEAKLNGKLETYYTNELDYGIQELTYDFNDCKKEYKLEGKESFTYEKRGNITIQRVSGVADTHKGNEATIGDFK